MTLSALHTLNATLSDVLRSLHSGYDHLNQTAYCGVPPDLMVGRMRVLSAYLAIRKACHAISLRQRRASAAAAMFRQSHVVKVRPDGHDVNLASPAILPDARNQNEWRTEGPLRAQGDGVTKTKVEDDA